jgi:hypothetical protein
VIPARIFKIAALVAALSLGIAALGHELFYLPWLRSILARGESPLQDTSPEALETEIRAALPLSSSRSAVEVLLRLRQIPYSYTSAEQIEALAHDLKETNPSGRNALWLRFDFDDHDVLRDLQSRVIRTPVTE